MGGTLFTTPGSKGEPALSVPRLPTELYLQLKAEYIALLSEYYFTVDTPREAPEKVDHGDIDVMTEGRKFEFLIEDLYERLQAVRWFPNGPTTSFAVPHPEIKNAYSQLDVHECPEDSFKWEYFMQSYSDLWQIFGISLRNLGVVANDKGFNCCIAEIETYNKKLSKVLLSQEPREIMEFLGVSAEMYEAGFKSMDEMFHWITECRFFSRALLDSRTEKSNDRARLKKRPLYQRFINEYIPAHPEAGTGRPEWTREGVLHEALRFFHKENEYCVKMEEHESMARETAFWDHVKEQIPRRGTALGIATRALKGWVDFKSGHFVIRDKPKVWQERSQPWVRQFGELDEDAVLRWIDENWASIYALEKARVKGLKLPDNVQPDV